MGTAPPGVIAMWHGALATIPENWLLCDGSGGTPNLVARFLRGAPAGVNPGTTGGADSHEHASMTSAGGHNHGTCNPGGDHSHTVNSAGAHKHGTISDSGTASPLNLIWGANTLGGHQHTTNASGGHTHTSASTGAHTHTINPADGRPPYYEVAFIQAGDPAEVVAGIIIIWTGLLANVPAGWALCDGGDTRPDLRTRFVRGINTPVTNPGTTGGAATHIHTEQAWGSHSHDMNWKAYGEHSFNSYSWIHVHDYNRTEGAVLKYQCNPYSGSHTHATTTDGIEHTHILESQSSFGDAHTVNAASSLPSYFDVAYIICTSGTNIPLGGILVWAGLLVDIPAEWLLCDGADGRPDLRARFLGGSAAGVDPGGTGGSNTHTHTDVATGSHNHTVTTSSNYQHAPTDTIGTHTHGDLSVYRLSSTVGRGQDANSGNHSHTFNTGGAHTHTGISSMGSHDHNPWSTDDGRPAYYEVAFIWKSLTIVNVTITEAVAAKETIQLQHIRSIKILATIATKERMRTQTVVVPPEIHVQSDGADLALFDYEVTRALNRPATVRCKIPLAASLMVGDDLTVIRGQASKALARTRSLERHDSFLTVEAQCYMQQLVNTPITQSYYGKTMTEIVKDAVDLARGQGYIDVTTNNVGSSIQTYEEIEYTGKKIYDVLNDWHRTEGWDFWIDKNRDLHFVDVSPPPDSGVDITEGGNLIQYVRANDILDLQNKVEIYGRVASMPGSGDGWTEHSARQTLMGWPQGTYTSFEISSASGYTSMAQGFKVPETAQLAALYINVDSHCPAPGTCSCEWTVEICDGDQEPLNRLAWVEITPPNKLDGRHKFTDMIGGMPTLQAGKQFWVVITKDVSCGTPWDTQWFADDRPASRPAADWDLMRKTGTEWHAFGSDYITNTILRLPRAGTWVWTDQGDGFLKGDDMADRKAGEAALEGWRWSGTGQIYYALPQALNLMNYVKLKMWIKTESVILRLYSGASDNFYRTVTTSGWEEGEFVVGAADGWSTSGSPSWTNITKVAFESNASTKQLHVDQFRFEAETERKHWLTWISQASIDKYWLEGQRVVNDNILTQAHADALAQLILDTYSDDLYRSRYVCAGILNVDPGEAVDVSIPSQGISLTQAKVISVKWSYNGSEETTEIILEEEPVAAQPGVENAIQIVKQEQDGKMVM